MQWENLNIDEFDDGLIQSKGVVLVPIGCLEKHGSHMPLGTDITIAREMAIRASAIESAMVFPYIPFGIVGEVKHKLGTISLSSNLIYHLLEELCDELVRNGFNKIIFVDGHGGNTNFLKYFLCFCSRIQISCSWYLSCWIFLKMHILVLLPIQFLVVLCPMFLKQIYPRVRV